MLRIATFNVNSIKSRLPILGRFFERDDAPDIICIQETKCQDFDFPVEAINSLGYKSLFKGMKSYNGVAILSREEPDKYFFGFGDGEDSEQDPARLCTARFGDVTIINSYVPQGKSMDHPDFKYKLRFFERINELLEKSYSSGDMLLWTGDLNVAPLDMDVTNPNNKRDHVCFCQETKDAFESVKSWGLADVFRKHRPEPGEFSFWDYRVANALERNIGWRIDHLLCTAPMAEKSLDAYVVRDLRAMERPSDHTAVVGVFDIKL